MSIPSFLKEREEKIKENKKNSKKGNYKEKCLNLLQEIKTLNEERYQKLSTIFHARRLDSDNVRKHLIMGFYAQLTQELKGLKESISDKIENAAPMIENYTPPQKVEVKKETPKKKEISRAPAIETSKSKKEVKKEEKKVEKKPAKKTAKKTTKKVAKKTTKKVAKKTAKKTTKKKTTKKAAAKKTAKKVTKKAAKKTTKKKTTKKKRR